MKKYLIIFIVFLLIIFSFNINVTTRKGVNYAWSSVRIPLYLKLLDFFDRHYNYKYLVNEIVVPSQTEEDKVIKILEWVNRNILRPPKGLPLIDDHVWHIIVRGYGTSDQFSDVFTVLCNYAGMEAFFTGIYPSDKSRKRHFSFVKINKKWFVFDPYCGVYFKNKDTGGLVDLENIRSALVYSVANREEEVDYAQYFNSFPSIKEIGLNRANIQSPFRRLLFELNKLRNKTQ